MMNEVQCKETSPREGRRVLGSSGLSCLQFREKWKSGGVEVTVGSKEILQPGQSEEMGVFGPTRCIRLNGIFDPSMPCSLLVQGAFKDGGGLQGQKCCSHQGTKGACSPAAADLAAAAHSHSCPWEV